MATEKMEQKTELKGLRLTPSELAKVQRLAPIAGAQDNFSEAVRWIIRIAPEPEQLAQMAFQAR